jgi:hypothetical protein
MTIVDIREHDGRYVLAVDTGVTARTFAQSKLSTMISAAGIILDPAGGATEWLAEGTFRDGEGSRERMYVYGPAFAGTSLLAAFSQDRAAAWKLLNGAILLLHKAVGSGLITKEQLTAIAGAGPESILVSEDGRVLVLPSEIYTRCIVNQGARIDFENRLRWIHPDYLTITPSRSFSFLAGTAAYRIVAGRSPFERSIDMGGAEPDGNEMPFAEDTARSIRKSIFEPLELAVWNIRPAAAACINTLVSTELAASPDTLIAFGPDFSAILDPAKEGVSETPEFIAAREQAAKRREFRIKKERFFRKNRYALMIGGVILLAAAILTGTWINDQKAKPTTLGLSPLEVVSGYYKAIDTLDQAIPEAYLDRGVKTDYAEFTTNIFVTSKIRQSYEQGAGILTPAELFALKKPDNRSIYGIVRLNIEEKTVSATSATYAVSFCLWLPMSEKVDVNASDDTVQLSVYRYADEVTLEYRKDRWIISGIRPETRSLLEGDGAKILASVADGSADAQDWAPTADAIQAALADIQKRMQGQQPAAAAKN